MPWYDDNKLVAGLTNALVEAEVFEDASDVTALLKSPFKYDEYYKAWESAGYPESEDDEGWEEFVESVTPGETEESAE